MSYKKSLIWMNSFLEVLSYFQGGRVLVASVTDHNPQFKGDESFATHCIAKDFFTQIKICLNSGFERSALFQCYECYPQTDCGGAVLDNFTPRMPFYVNLYCQIASRIIQNLQQQKN